MRTRPLAAAVTLGLMITGLPMPAYAFDSGKGFDTERFLIRSYNTEDCVSTADRFRGTFLGWERCDSTDLAQQFEVFKAPREGSPGRVAMSPDDPALNNLRTVSTEVPEAAANPCVSIISGNLNRAPCRPFPANQWQFRVGDHSIYGGLTTPDLTRGCWKKDHWDEVNGGKATIVLIACDPSQPEQQWEIVPVN